MPDFVGWSGYYRSIGYEVAGELKGAVIFTNASATNVNLATVLEAPLTRKFLRAIFFYPFLGLKVKRITALVDASNTRSIRLTKSAGFKFEGCLREAAPDGDTLIFGMLKGECRFLT